MRIGKLFGRFAPALAGIAALGLAGCGGMDVEIDNNGVPLAELDMSGDMPTGVVLAGPDEVEITSGDDFTIDVSGSAEAQDRMRFAVEDGSLTIHRSEGSWSDTDVATVNVTMPAPRSLVLAGAGSLTTDAMTDDPEIVIAGSGRITTANVAASSMEVTVAGSGTLNASGTANRLELTNAGSGSANMESLQVANAEVTIAGSGDASFASDGAVDATIVGSGTVRVIGDADCTVESLGSGSVECARTTRQSEDA